jgi:hypothetical protein
VQGGVEDGAASRHVAEQLGHDRIILFEQRRIDGKPVLVRIRPLRHRLISQVAGVRDRIDARIDNFERRRGKDHPVRPDAHALAMRLSRDCGHETARKIGVNLDGGRIGSFRACNRERHVGLRVDRLHPWHLAGDGALCSSLSARIVKEARAGHQRGISDVWRRDFPDARCASDIRDLPQIIGHVAGPGNATVDVTPQPRLGFPSIGRRRQMLVRIDEARD